MRWRLFPKINSDLFVMAYATYVAALADASLQDNQEDASLFAFLQKTLERWKRVWIIKFWPIFLKFKYWHVLESVSTLMSVPFVIVWGKPLTSPSNTGVVSARSLPWRWETMPFKSQYSLSAQSISSHWFWDLGDHFAQAWNQAGATPIYGSTLRRVRWDSPKIKEIYWFPSRLGTITKRGRQMKKSQ